MTAIQSALAAFDTLADEYVTLVWAIYPNVDKTPLRGSAGPYTPDEAEQALARLVTRAAAHRVRVPDATAKAAGVPTPQRVPGQPFLTVLAVPYSPDIDQAPMPTKDAMP